MNLEATKIRRSKKKLEYKFCQETQNLNEEEYDEPGLSKRHHVLGPLDKIIDTKKLKQSTINVEERKK